MAMKIRTANSQDPDEMQINFWSHLNPNNLESTLISMSQQHDIHKQPC